MKQCIQGEEYTMQLLTNEEKMMSILFLTSNPPSRNPETANVGLQLMF